MTRLSHAETNKAIRQHLKEVFPSTTFSVRKHGDLTEVAWEDGCKEASVHAELMQFQSSRYDAMSDYHEPVDNEYTCPYLQTHRSNSTKAAEEMMKRVEREEDGTPFIRLPELDDSPVIVGNHPEASTFHLALQALCKVDLPY